MLFPGLDNRHLIAPGHFKEYVANRQCNSWMLTYIHLLGCPVDTERYIHPPRCSKPSCLHTHVTFWDFEPSAWDGRRAGRSTSSLRDIEGNLPQGHWKWHVYGGRNSHFTSLHISPKARLRPNQALPKKKNLFLQTLLGDANAVDELRPR